MVIDGDNSINKENSLKPYQVNRELIKKARKDAVFMHCLPAHRGKEVTNEVIDSNQSIVLKYPYLRESYSKPGKSVSSVIMHTFPNTFVLAASSIIIALIIYLMDQAFSNIMNVFYSLF